jgi:hypothetical protein
MDVVTSKVSSKVQGLLKWEISKVLIAECYHFALSDEESELVFSCWGEFAELNASHFGSDDWSEFLDLAAFGKEVLEGWICALSMLDVGEWLQFGVFLAFVPSREIGRIL